MSDIEDSTNILLIGDVPSNQTTGYDDENLEETSGDHSIALTSKHLKFLLVKTYLGISFTNLLLYTYKKISIKP